MKVHLIRVHSDTVATLFVERRIHWVEWQRWQSHHSILHIRKPHAARKLRGSMFYRTGVIADRNFTLWK